MPLIAPSDIQPIHYRVLSCVPGCVVVDELCLVPEEVPNYEAIKSLHSQLDDDHSGDIDLAESVDVSAGCQGEE